MSYKRWPLYPASGSATASGTEDTCPLSVQFFHYHAVFGKKLCRIVGWRPLSAVVAPTLGIFGSVTGGGNIGDGLNFVTCEQTFSL